MHEQGKLIMYISVIMQLLSKMKKKNHRTLRLEFSGLWKLSKTSQLKV